MNLFTEYQQLIQNCLIKIQKDNKIDLPENLKGLTVELPPKNQTADISCNAAMILAKSNNTSPNLLAEKIKKHLLLNFKEFSEIEIAGPGFLNISFNSFFWTRREISGGYAPRATRK